MKSLCSVFIFFFIGIQVFAQNDLSYYLPQDITYNSDIPTPKEVLGYEVGEWHVNNDQLYRYMETVANASDRVSMEIYARSYENRPLMLLTITSENNQENIESIRNDHLNFATNLDSEKSLEEQPVVVWLGYSVHGNESSGTNSALLSVYYLAAAEGDKIESLLENTIILIDPMINPDGNMRFSSWVNSRRGKNLNPDPQNWEQNEPWPGGRTNHYWFDLNRDWLLLQHPESRGRLNKFHSWKPNILTDHHEMGTNATFFFQPGEPSRNHPLTPNRNFNLTQQIADYHISALDKIGSLYYSKEGFDDFYYGKGSTYPDVNGGIGILFEQASSRSHLQESTNGLLSFPFTIKNQFTTSLSTLEAAKNLRSELLSHQRQFYSESSSLASSDNVKAIVYGTDDDPERLNAFNELLSQHQINFHHLKSEFNSSEFQYKPSNSFIVSLNQPQYRLIKAIFEKRTQFQDSLFYDVSAWTIPLAFNLNYQEISARSFNSGTLIENKAISSLTHGNTTNLATYAYGLNWKNYRAAEVVYSLLSQGLRCRVATRPFTDSQGKSFDYGTIVIPLKNQLKEPGEIHDIFRSLKESGKVEVYEFNSGNVTSGAFLGSNTFDNLELPSIGILVGPGITSYDAGEAWRLLDERFNIPVSLLSIENIDRIDLGRYNRLIMTDGSYSRLANKQIESIRNWVSAGGNILAFKRAGRWLNQQGISTTEYETIDTDTTEARKRYADRQKYNGAQVVGGAIFKVRMDLTHPLAFGYNQDELPIFKKGMLAMKTAKSHYAQPIQYLDNPLMSGYVSKENLAFIRSSPAVTVSRTGKGRIISFVDNPNFRAYWYGTQKLFLNSLFFAPIINP